MKSPLLPPCCRPAAALHGTPPDGRRKPFQNTWTEPPARGSLTPSVKHSTALREAWVAPGGSDPAPPPRGRYIGRAAAARTSSPIGSVEAVRLRLRLLPAHFKLRAVAACLQLACDGEGLRNIYFDARGHSCVCADDGGAGQRIRRRWDGGAGGGGLGFGGGGLVYVWSWAK